MLSPQEEMYNLLTEENKSTINNLIEFLYSKQNQAETKQAVQDALSGNTAKFESIEDFFKDLYEEN